MNDKQSYLYNGSSIEIEQNSYFGDSVRINGLLIFNNVHFMGYAEGIVIIKKLILPHDDVSYFVWYLIDYLGNKYKVGENYKWITPFKGTLSTVTPIQEKNGLFGIINKKGTLIVPCILNFDEITSYGDDNYAKVVKEGKIGIIDDNGNIIVSCQYDSIHVFRLIIGGKERAFIFNNDLALVKKVNKWGCVNKKGVEVIPCIYDSISINNNGIVKVTKDKECNYLDKTGKDLFINKNVNLNYEIIDSKEGFIIVKQKEKYGLLDKTGSEIITCIHNNIDNLLSRSLNNNTTSDNDGIADFCIKNQNAMISNSENDSFGILKTPLFQNENIKGYILLTCEGNRCANYIMIKKYVKTKVEESRNNVIAFECANHNTISYNYKDGIYTFIPTLNQWVTTCRIEISDKDLLIILKDSSEVSILSNMTIHINALYREYLCLRYLLRPESCNGEFMTELQGWVKIEKEKEVIRFAKERAEAEAKRKAIEEEAKRKAAEEDAKRKEAEEKRKKEEAELEARKKLRDEELRKQHKEEIRSQRAHLEKSLQEYRYKLFFPFGRHIRWGVWLILLIIFGFSTDIFLKGEDNIILIFWFLIFVVYPIICFLYFLNREKQDDDYKYEIKSIKEQLKDLEREENGLS